MAPNPRPSLYQVEIAPAAWRQLANLSQEHYLAFQGRLRELAAQTAAGLIRQGVTASAVSGQGASRFPGGLTVRYEVDDVRRMVRLLDVLPQGETSAHAPSAPDGEGLSE